jgi:hypothetical protein
MVIRVNPHGEGIGEPGYGMRRLQHLTGIEGVEVGIIVVEAPGELEQHLSEGPGVFQVGPPGRKTLESRRHIVKSTLKERENLFRLTFRHRMLLLPLLSSTLVI